MLILEIESERGLRREALSRRVVSIGRGKEADVVVEATSLSRRHFTLTLEGDGVRVADLGSTNGLWVSGQKVRGALVPVGRWFVAGHVRFRVTRRLDPAALKAASPESTRPAAPPPASDSPPAKRPPIASEPPRVPTPAKASIPGSRLSHGARGAPRPSLAAPAPAPPPPRRAAAPPASPAAPGRSPEAGREESRRRGLVARLEGARGHEATLEALLDDFLVRLRVRGVVLLGRASGAAKLRAMAGARLMPQAEARLVEEAERVVEQGPGAVRKIGEALVCRVAGAPRAAGWLIAHPWDERPLPELELRELAALAARLVELSLDESGRPVERATEGDPIGSFLAASARGRALLDEVARLAELGAPVLLVGPAGVGKDHLAAAIHASSPRSFAPFVAVDCSSMRPARLEAHLFGRRAPGESNSARRPGAFQIAEGGTLLLSNVEALDPGTQVRLVAALDEARVTPSGSTRAEAVDVRVIGATREDLVALVREDAFNKALFRRLATSTLRVPALAERPEDLVFLAERFAQDAARAIGTTTLGFDLEAMQGLLAHAWPHNVVELRRVVHRAVACAEGPVLRPADLPAGLDAKAAGDSSRADLYVVGLPPFAEARAAFEARYFSELVDRCSGRLADAASTAGLSREELFSRLEALDHGFDAAEASSPSDEGSGEEPASEDEDASDGEARDGASGSVDLDSAPLSR